MSIDRPYPSKPSWGAANLVEFVCGLKARIKNAFVSKTGDESIDGTKTFSSSPLVPTPAAGSDTNVPATTEWVNDAIGVVDGKIDALDANVVKLSGDQIVGGTKTFSNTIAGSINGNAATATRVLINDYDGDLDNLKTTGFYYAESGDVTNLPVGSNGQIIVIDKGSFKRQIFMRSGTPGTNDHQIYSREYSDTNQTWGPWFYFLTSKHLPLSVANGGTGQTALINNTALGNLGWTTDIGARVITGNTIAFWNGRYNSSSSNLQYCKNGEIVGTTGDQTIAGIKTFSSPVVITHDDVSVRRSNKTGALRLTGGNSASAADGAMLSLFGSSHSSLAGYVRLYTGNGPCLEARPNGTLTWNDRYFIYADGDQTISGTKTFAAANLKFTANTVSIVKELSGDPSSTRGMTRTTSPLSPMPCLMLGEMSTGHSFNSVTPSRRRAKIKRVCTTG